MEKKKIWKDERVQAGVLVLAAFLLLTAWAFMQPLGAGPDEKMRYMVAQYLHEHPRILHIFPWKAVFLLFS